MKAVELLLPSGKPAGVWCCSECRHVYNDKDVTERCCTCNFCGQLVPRDSIGKGTNYTGQHGECWQRHHDERYAKLLAEAVVDELYTGMVYSEEFQGRRDGFFDSVDDFLESVEYDDVNWDEDEQGNVVKRYPSRVFCCEPAEPSCVDLGDVLERMFSDSFEDASEQANGTKELAAALDAFWEANRKIVTYRPDFKRCVLVPSPKSPTEETP